MGSMWRAIAIALGVVLCASVLPAGAEQPPSTPTGLTHSVVDGSTVLRWQPSTDDGSIHGYDIYRDGGYDTSTSTAELVIDGEAAEWRVVAVDDDGNYSGKSEPHPVGPATTPDDTDGAEDGGGAEDEGGDGATDSVPPDQRDEPAVGPRPTMPADVRLEWRAEDLSWALTWDPSSDDRGVAGYNINVDGAYAHTVNHTVYLRDAVSYASPEYGRRFSVAAFDGDENFSETTTELIVVNDGNRGAMLAELDAPAATEAPGAPHIFSGGERSDGAMSIAWNASPSDNGVAGYNIYRSDGTKLGSTEGRYNTVFSSPELRHGESYYVVGFNNAGVSSQRSRLFTIRFTISGTPQTSRGYAQTIAATQVPPQSDLGADIRADLSALFVEFAPTRGDGYLGERSQKRQRDLNRRLTAAILGFDYQAMFTHWSQLGVGDQNLYLMMQTPTSTEPLGPVSEASEFNETWARATTRERLDYLEIDPVEWNKAMLFYEAYKTNMSNLYEIDRAQTDQIFNVLVGLGVGVITADWFSAYGLIAAGAAGGAAGAATTTALSGGSGSEILEEAAIGALKGALSGGISERFGLTGWERWASSGLVGAIDYAARGGQDPRVGALAAMIPEVGEKAEEFDAYTFEAASADAIEALKPVFGAEGAALFVQYATETVDAVLGELLVLYALVPDMDIEVEAERILGNVMEWSLDSDRQAIFFAAGDHLRDVVNAGIRGSVESSGNPAAVRRGVEATLDPTVARFIASATLQTPEAVATEIVQEIVDIRASGTPLSEWSATVPGRLVSRWNIAILRS